MSHQIIKQPDGKLAVFSSGTGTWIISDAEPQELLDYYAERAATAARESATETIAHVLADEPQKAYYQFVMTFAKANAESKYRGGEVLPGPLDAGYLAELEHPDDDEQEPGDSMDQHLIFGSDLDNPDA